MELFNREHETGRDPSCQGRGPERRGKVSGDQIGGGKGGDVIWRGERLKQRGGGNGSATGRKVERMVESGFLTFIVLRQEHWKKKYSID